MCTTGTRVQPALLWILVALLGCAAPGDRAFTGYVGHYVDSGLADEILIGEDYETKDAHLAVLAYSEAFHTFSKGAGQWGWEGQVGRYFGQQSNMELNGLVTLRWRRFPWSSSVRTSMTIGEGLSLASEVPPLEDTSQGNEGASQLLNYLLLELSLGPPGTSPWDFVLRIHHRSGVFGLYDGVDGGSNVVAVGLRFTF